jgi:Tfp pilus assembly protein PilF
MESFEQNESGQAPNREQLLQMAIATAKTGNRDGARMMLNQVLEQDRRNERAMLWMARITKSSKERRQWLERVLDVNPDNEQAQTQLRKMKYRSSAQQNRTLLLFGVVVGVLVVLALAVFLILRLTAA